MLAALKRTVIHGSVALLVVAVPTKVRAQDSLAHARSTFWGFAALGIGGAADSAFYAAGVGAAWQRRKLILMTRFASVGPEEENRMSDAGLLVGIGTQGGRFHYLAAAGLAAARSSQDSTALALPLEAHATWRFAKWGGIGLRGFLSINKLATFGGLTVVAEVGRLR